MTVTAAVARRATTAGAAIGAWLLAGSALAQGQPAAPPAPPSAPGRPLGVSEGERFTPISANGKVYGAVASAESCVYDPAR